MAITNQQELLLEESLLNLLCRIKLTDAYKDEWTCKGIVRILPPIAKSYCLRMLSSGVHLNPLWAGTNVTKHNQAVESLRNLKLLTETDELIEDFRTSLIRALLQPQNACPFPLLKSNDRSKDLVDEEAFENWGTVLNFLVAGGNNDSQIRKKGPQSTKSRRLEEFKMPSGSIQHLLVQMGLVSLETNSITGLGYGFTLKDVYTQVRLLLQCIIRQSTSNYLVSTLFKLSFSPRDAMLQIPKGEDLSLLKELGLIVTYNNSFCVSSIGVNALFGTTSTLSAELQPKHGLQNMQIIVETTFKVYCYTSAALHEKMLGHFVALEAILPNLIVGSITRESVTQALKKGITALQIIDFLTQNAHPQAKGRVHIVPDNVKDQIILWEKETKRIIATPGYILYSFKTQENFLTVLQHAQSKQYVAWSDATSKRLFVKKEGMDDMRVFIKSLKSSNE